MGDVPEPQNEEIRTTYAQDRQLKASVIPSGRAAGQGGGSYAFDANNPDIPQNIIVCEGGEMKKIAQVTRKDLAGVNAANRQRHENTAVREAAAEDFYRNLDASKNQQEEQPKRVPFVVSAEGVPIAQPSAPPVYVTIKGPFGRIKQPFSKVFRDGAFLILKADHNTLATSYELPELEDDEVMRLELKIGDHVVQCIHAGIRFTEDDASATFTVLLVQEETDIEEGRLRQAR
jgi:hypothetical protein